MTKWAILIGVNKCRSWVDLPGCLNDVKNMSNVLQKQYGFRREHMVEMTSSDCYGPDYKANLGGQIRDTLPTYGNIISSFMTIRKEGKPGDLAYIHFSGVTTAVQPILPAYAELPAVSDLALPTASCDATSEGEKSLQHDVKPSALLNTLFEKGLEVTAVLDCRHALPHDFRSSRSDHSHHQTILAPHPRLGFCVTYNTLPI